MFKPTLTRPIRAVVAAPLLIALSSCTQPTNGSTDAADTLYVDGLIWTGDPANPWADSLAIDGDRIVAVGSTEAMEPWRGPKTEQLDLGGKLVVPGFQDSHLHIIYNASPQVDLSGAETLPEVQRRIETFANANPELPWIEGFGWAYSAFPDQQPRADYLDAVVADRPVFILSRDAHMGLANSNAMRLADIDDKTPDPENGRVVRDDAGEVTGEFQESAMTLIRALIPEPDAQQRYRALLSKSAEAAAVGITAYHEAGVRPENIAVFERAAAEDALLQRVELALRMVTPDARTEVPRDTIAAHIKDARALRDRLQGPYLRARSIKGMLDGTIDATTAAMFEPYVDTDTPGLPFWDADTLNATVALYDAAGFQVILHGIGDRAIAEALDAFAHAAAENGERDARHRIEHAEMPRLADLERFRDMGVIASTQPMFAYPDATVLGNFAPLLGHERAQHADNFALWDDAGVRQVFGSDHPVMTLSPLRGIETAVTRTTEAGTPAGGWYPDGRIGVEAALRHYTTDAAFGTHDEAARGMLKVGQFADFVVLSDNIFDIPPDRISETRVLRTVMGGRDTFVATSQD